MLRPPRLTPQKPPTHAMHRSPGPHTPCGGTPPQDMPKGGHAHQQTYTTFDGPSPSCTPSPRGGRLPTVLMRPTPSYLSKLRGGGSSRGSGGGSGRGVRGAGGGSHTRTRPGRPPVALTPLPRAACITMVGSWYKAPPDPPSGPTRCTKVSYYPSENGSQMTVPQGHVVSILK